MVPGAVASCSLSAPAPTSRLPAEPPPAAPGRPGLRPGVRPPTAPRGAIDEDTGDRSCGSAGDVTPAGGSAGRSSSLTLILKSDAEDCSAVVDGAAAHGPGSAPPPPRGPGSGAVPAREEPACVRAVWPPPSSDPDTRSDPAVRPALVASLTVAKPPSGTTVLAAMPPRPRPPRQRRLTTGRLEPTTAAAPASSTAAAGPAPAPNDDTDPSEGTGPVLAGRPRAEPPESSTVTNRVLSSSPVSADTTSWAPGGIVRPGGLLSHSWLAGGAAGGGGGGGAS